LTIKFKWKILKMKILVAASVPLVVAACSPLEPLPVGAENTSSTHLSTHLQAAPSVEYLGYQVVEPADWRRVNDSQREN
tara:strand:+ start:154 stop:390 length:237 start_codon:yes stop_codon:yes gene_type:complete